MKKEKKFNKNEYDKEYHKEHYKRFVMNLKPDFFDLISTVSSDLGMNKTEFVTNCINYCIENGVFNAGTVEDDLDADIIYSDTDIQ